MAAYIILWVETQKHMYIHCLTMKCYPVTEKICRTLITQSNTNYTLLNINYKTEPSLSQAESIATSSQDIQN